ncbi:MAG: homoserine dehydrogenase [Thermodesulfobacteria bacterium]|nr:homoserine dehydrogenase [Thermodesulfobacteriota bacterium]
MQEVKIGLLGCGTVGTGVYELLEKNKDIIAERTGFKPVIKKILVKNKKKGRKIPGDLLTTDPREILQDPEIEVVCELIGGEEPAKTFILEALDQGKEVVTANKAVLASYGEVIWNKVAEKDRFLGFEASVGGGIPIIKTLKDSLVGNRINSIIGIINGTTNYILTRMLEERLGFEEALKEAQAKGYAEADPTLDINGMDSAHKIAILASLAFGFFIPVKKVYVEGIESVDLLDLEFSREFGYVVKLLAFAIKKKNEVEVRVHPALIPQDHVLASIRLNYNALYVTGDFVGEILLYGLGAGKEPTASAVVGDIVDAICYRYAKGCISRVNPLTKSSNFCKIKPMEEVEFKYYFRFSAIDRPGVLAKISGILGENHISISSVVQIGRHNEGGCVPIVMITHETKEKNVRKALKQIEKLDVVTDVPKFLRIL